MIRLVLLFVLFSLTVVSPAWAQRNASFLDPASGGGPAKSEKGGPAVSARSLVADPSQTDAGETLVNVARRVTVFFFNGFGMPVQLTQLTLNADGNVRSKVLTDDCRVIQTLPPQDRCSIVMEIVPSSPGPWSVELLMNHSGQGRIARAEVTGTTLGKTDEKAQGLAISKKIAAALDFGQVRANEESVARTMLIENDSTEPLKISSIDLITRDDQGLNLRPVGCEEGDELQPGESCPLTVMWEPEYRGNIATDLIVRHSGGLGFVVVPIRGVATADDGKGGSGGVAARPKSSFGTLAPKNRGDSVSSMPGGFLPPVPDAIQPLPVGEITRPAPTARAERPTSPPAVEAPMLAPSAPAMIALIGTVNGRAILGDSSNQTYVVSLGETTMIDDQTVELLQLESTRAVLNIGGVRKELFLRRAPAVVKRSASTDGGTSASSRLGNPSGDGGAASEEPLPAVPSPGIAPPAPVSPGSGVEPESRS
jgi:hypothetical protein